MVILKKKLLDIILLFKYIFVNLSYLFILLITVKTLHTMFIINNNP
jgi:hypothetical protein